MKQPFLFIAIGILVIIGGFRDNEYRLIPEFLYYLFGGLAIVFGIYKLLANSTEDNTDVE